MPFLLFTTTSNAVAARAATVAINLYLYGHAAYDSWRVGRWAAKKVNEKLKQRRDAEHKAAYDGAREGVKETQATAA